jgi:hypothetical protein
MNFKTAAIVGGSAFVLSLLMGLVGGVPLLDIFVRALFWGAFGFGAALGIEKLLRMMVPELFADAPDAERVERAPADQAEPAPQRVVDIVVEDEAPTRYRANELPPDAAPTADTGEAAAAAEAAATGEPGSAEEEMPEIGSFLDAFKPGASEGAPGEGGEAGRAPDVGEYAPQSSDPSLDRASEVTIDGEAQDPAILAKAVQTVMKRDGQGT